MRKFIAAFLSVFMIFGITGCSKEKSPDEVVKITLAALKEGDYIKASEYINYEELMDAAGEVEIGELEGLDSQDMKELEELAALLFKELEYKILSFEEEKASAVVQAEITNIDMSEVLGEVFLQMFTLAFSGLEEEEMNEKAMEAFTESMSQEERSLVTNTVDIELTKEEDKWKINITDELLDGIFGGVISTIENMKDSF
ncbi:DUF5105 domain-containing protein [Alloiococcus sp. CFN-8]|uniref:DUF5105 domain-containing protein n=1 Tax=Alloiococcus sp. CFN-8 TaxID=3416081 RepID=UPI003CE8B4E6